MRYRARSWKPWRRLPDPSQRWAVVDRTSAINRSVGASAGRRVPPDPDDGLRPDARRRRSGVQSRELCPGRRDLTLGLPLHLAEQIPALGPGVVDLALEPADGRSPQIGELAVK